MPEKLSRLWQDSPVLILVQKLTERMLKRTHWITGLIIAMVMGIIALLLLLQQLDWSFKEKFKLLNLLEIGINILQNLGLNKIKQLVNQIADLRQAELLLGERDFETSSNKLPGMDAMASLADTIAPFNPMISHSRDCYTCFFCDNFTEFGMYYGLNT